MRKSILAATVVVALLLILGSHKGRADEEKIPVDKLPKSVLETVKKRFPEGKLVGAAKEVENGVTVYEVEVKDKDVNMDVTLSAEGTLLGIEKEVAAKDFPKIVLDAIETKYPKAEFKKAEELIKVKDGIEKLEAYEALLLTTDKKTIEVVVSLEGKITKVEEVPTAAKDKK